MKTKRGFSAALLAFAFAALSIASLLSAAVSPDGAVRDSLLRAPRLSLVTVAHASTERPAGYAVADIGCMEVGQRLTLQVTSGGAPVESGGQLFHTQDRDILTVSPTGVVTAKAPGTAQVIVCTRRGGNPQAVSVQVVEPGAPRPDTKSRAQAERIAHTIAMRQHLPGLDANLTDAAMRRASELALYESENRPDGTGYKTALARDEFATLAQKWVKLPNSANAERIIGELLTPEFDEADAVSVGCVRGETETLWVPLSARHAAAHRRTDVLPALTSSPLHSSTYSANTARY